MDDYPKPLRIVKSPPSQNTRKTRSESFPEIPVRRSSIRDSIDMFSGYPPSPPTPTPMAGGMDRLNVRKTRGPEGRSSDATMSSPPQVQESPFGNCRCPSEATSNRIVSTEEEAPDSKTSLVKKFFRSFDSRSRKPSTENRVPISYPFPMELEGSTTNTSKRPSGEVTYVFKNPALRHPSFPFEQRAFGPVRTPVITAELETVPESEKIGVEERLLFCYIRVSFDMPKLGEPDELKLHVPLDIIYILDNTSGTPDGKDREVCDIVYMCANMLDRKVVRFAVACVDGNAEGGLKYLLPLGKHTRQEAKTEIDKLHQHRLAHGKQEGLMLRKAVREASHALMAGDGKALGHIVLVTYDPPNPFPMPKLDPRVGFHTISPGVQFNCTNAVPPFGWHISTHTYSTVGSFVERVNHVMSHLHTGINPGAVSHLTLKMNAGDGCQIESTVNNIRFDKLRLGETWTVPVSVRVPAASIEQMLRRSISEEEMPVRNDANLNSDDLFSQLQNILDIPEESEPQRIFSALLEYSYSPLPNTRVSQIVHCDIIRTLPRPPRTPERLHNAQGIHSEPHMYMKQPFRGSRAPFGGPNSPGGLLNAPGAYLGGSESYPRLQRSFEPSSAYGSPPEWTEERHSYRAAPFANSMHNLRGVAAGPHGTPHQTFRENTNILREWPFNQRHPSPMTSSSSRGGPRGLSFKDRVTKSHDNIRAKFKLFSDKQKLRGGLQEDFVPEETETENWI